MNFPKLGVSVVESNTQGSAGATCPSETSSSSCMRSCWGFGLHADSPDVEAAYRLFVDVWATRTSEDTG